MSDFPPLKNDLIIRAARGETTERAPVWVMRQAGRYLPEFRELRAKHDFFTICRTPELACEITLQPIRRYSGLLDAAIIFSDILVVPQAMGLEVVMLPGEGPHFPQPITTPEQADEVLQRKVDVEKELGYVFKAITLTRTELKGEVPLIGFCGAPWTLFAYMIEGGGSKTWVKAKTWLWKEPERSKALLQKIAEVSAQYLLGQVRAGAQLLQVFDSWAGELSPHTFRTFALPYLRYIVQTVKSTLRQEKRSPVPIIGFAKGANSSLRELAEAGYDVIGLDWCIEPKVAREAVKGVGKDEGRRVALQGNADPTILYGGNETIEEAVKRMIEGEDGFGKTGAYIANLGHGITPAVDPEAMKFFLECVHRFSKK